MINTEKMEVLFEDLCDESIASISGGTSTATVTVSGDGSSSSATAQVKTINPTAPTSTTSSPNSVFKITPFFDSSVNSLLAGKYTTATRDGGGLSITLTLQ